MTSPISGSLVCYTHEESPQKASLKVSDSISFLATNVSKLAVPLMIVYALDSLPGADAGPIAYATCVAACEALATVSTGGPGAAFIGQCIASCWPILALPTP